MAIIAMETSNNPQTSGAPLEVAEGLGQTHAREGQTAEGGGTLCNSAPLVAPFLIFFFYYFGAEFGRTMVVLRSSEWGTRCGKADGTHARLC